MDSILSALFTPIGVVILIIWAIVALNKKKPQVKENKDVGIDWWTGKPKNSNTALDIYNMPSREFEELVAEVFENHGYATSVTRQGGDGNKDVVAIKDGELVFIECKQGKHRLDVKEIRAFAHVCHRDRAKRGIMISVNGFTRNAIEEAKRARPRIQCMDGQQFQDMLDNAI